MGEHAAPACVKLDALNRAWRTLYTALGADVALLVGTGLLQLLDSVEVSSEAFWIGLGILIIKFVLTAPGSYMLRLKKAPRVDPEPTLTA